MAAIPIALILAILSATAHAQDIEEVLCVQNDAYALCEPDEVTIEGLPSLENQAGEVLTVSNDETALVWTAKGGGGGGGTPSDAIPSAPTASGAAGTDTAYSRGDHAHPSDAPAASTATPQEPTAAGATGASAAYSRGDHAHPSDAAAASTATPKSPTSSGAAGTAKAYSRGDHAHPSDAPAASTATPLKPTSAGATGTATAYARGDHAHPSDAVTPPTASDATPKSPTSSGAAGTNAAYSRGDHAHPSDAVTPPTASDATPKSPTSSGAAGTNAAYSRGDHAHPQELPANPSGTDNHWLRAKGAAKSWQPGEVVPHFTSSNKSQCAQVNALGTGITWGACGGGTSVSPSNATPKSPITNGTPGTATAYSRGDHRHPLFVPRASIVTPANALLAIKTSDSSSNPKWIAPTTAVLNGLPSTTGQAGNALTVNSAGTGVEWSAGGGGGGGGSSQWTLMATQKGASSSSTSVSTWTYSEGFDVASCWNDAQDRNWQAIRVTERNSTGSQIYTFTRWIGELPNVPSSQGFARYYESSQNNANTTASLGCSNTSLSYNPDRNLISNRDGNVLVHILPSLGGGGGDNPSIPKPTASGALKTLRVDAAGAAYELGVVAADAALVDELAESEQEELGKLLAKTSDLLAAGSSNEYVTNTEAGEGLYIGASIPVVEPSWSNEIDPPYPTTGRDVWVRLKKTSKLADYRLEIAFTAVSLESPGIDWEVHDRVSLTHDYYLASRGFSGNTMSLKLQKHPDRAGQSTFSGIVTGKIDSKQLTYIEGKTPGNLDIKVGRFWGVQTCTGSGDTHQCEADWIDLPAPPTPATRRERIAHGTQSGSLGAYSVSFPQSGSAALLHNHLISGRYQELRLQVRWAAIVNGSEMIGCTFPGLAKGDLLNAQRIVRVHGYGSSATGGFMGCGLVVGVSGDATLTWNPGGRAGLSTTSTYTLTGIRW